MIVLDTHVWLWWVSEPKRLSKRAAAAIEQADSIAISAISVWEVAMLNRRGRLELDRPAAQWVRTALASDERVHEVPLGSALAVRAVELEDRGLLGDPADRFIFATAELLRAELITKDRALRAFGARRSIW